MPQMKRLLIFIVMLLLLIGCTSNLETSKTASTNISAKKELVFGFTPGPYSDQVRKVIKPYLEKKGYKISIVEFNDIVQPNFALSKGELDVNIFQHTAYFKAFTKENKLNLSEVLKVPTAPMGLYSKKHKSLDEVNSKIKITAPNDPVNFARSLRILEEVNWLTLTQNINPLTVSEQNISKRNKDFSFTTLEQPQLPRSLDDADYALINGNFAIASGIKISEALAIEDPPFEYQNLVAVRQEDKNKQFVKDIIEAYHSPEFKKLIETDPSFKGFWKPDYMK
nr:MetQ/NlpA family ABC transporter substrate-binding protein [Bacillus sp. XF8]